MIGHRLDLAAAMVAVKWSEGAASGGIYLGVIGAEQRCALGQTELHPKTTRLPQQVGHRLTALFAGLRVGVIEVRPIHGEHLDLRHHRVSDGIGHGVVDQIVTKRLDHGLQRIGDRIGIIIVLEAGDHRLIVPLELGRIVGVMLLDPTQIVHHESLVVAEGESAPVNRPDLIEGLLVTLTAERIPAEVVKRRPQSY